MATVGGVFNFVHKNPHMGLSVLLFVIGIIALCANIPTLSGALFGAGASLLGAWVTEMNNHRANTEDKTRREGEARRYFAPELHRIIERVLYIHSRAIPNFTCAWTENSVKPTDLKEDFIPYMPVLYPSEVKFKDLSGEDAVALISFYDSLHNLEKFVNEWWEREGQLPANIFNMILHHATDSLTLAEVCIERFELEKSFPPKYESWGTLTSRIEHSKNSALASRQHHTANPKKLPTQVYPIKR